MSQLDRRLKKTNNWQTGDGEIKAMLDFCTYGLSILCIQEPPP